MGMFGVYKDSDHGTLVRQEELVNNIHGLNPEQYSASDVQQIFNQKYEEDTK